MQQPLGVDMSDPGADVVVDVGLVEEPPAGGGVPERVIDGEHDPVGAEHVERAAQRRGLDVLEAGLRVDSTCMSMPAASISAIPPGADVREPRLERGRPRWAG